MYASLPPFPFPFPFCTPSLPLLAIAPIASTSPPPFCTIPPSLEEADPPVAHENGSVGRAVLPVDKFNKKTSSVGRAVLPVDKFNQKTSSVGRAVPVDVFGNKTIGRY